MQVRLRHLRKLRRDEYRMTLDLMMTLDLIDSERGPWYQGDCVVQIDLLDAPGQHSSSARGLLKPALELYRRAADDLGVPAPLGYRRGGPPLRRPHLRGRAALPVRTPGQKRTPLAHRATRRSEGKRKIRDRGPPPARPKKGLVRLELQLEPELVERVKASAVRKGLTVPELATQLFEVALPQ